jgi:hypothetical protein
MESWQYVVALIESLESEGIGYMVVGSLSASVYGLTRSTKDADFVLQLGERTLQDVLQNLGPEFKLERQLSFETNTGTTRQRIFVGDNAFLIELFRLSDDAHDLERFARRQFHLVAALARKVWVPTAEDVVITKLRWISTANRPKDREDVATVLAVQRDKLDWNHIYRWCDVHGTRGIADELRASVPVV